MRFAVLLLLLAASPAWAQIEQPLPQPLADSSLVAAAHLYASAWLLADSSAMASAIHPAARRQVVHTIDGAAILEEQDAATMASAAGELMPQPDQLDQIAVRVIIQDETSAVVDVRLPLWTERVTFVRWNDAWKVTHSAWRLKDDSSDGLHAH